MTRGKSPVRQFRTPGSVKGAVGNHGPYSNSLMLTRGELGGGSLYSRTRGSNFNP
jgi:hypothetical protein